MRRTIFTPEHEQFRQMVRAFLAKECVPHTAEWLQAGVVSREAWRKAGELGLLGWMVPEEYGGLGIRDFRYSVVLTEELARATIRSIGPSNSLKRWRSTGVFPLGAHVARTDGSREKPDSSWNTIGACWRRALFSVAAGAA